ncbi:DUF763 domain-containing protein, partial [Candidatus Woesearchaeota archaeon]|nr:DUF763 domain-containing protein [Candidatus Woesearchaeota archaeon]
FSRMTKLSGTIAKVIVDSYGQDELLKRLSDPFWFQSFGCVLGFDWHSSGLTTTVCGALKQSLNLEEHGIVALGGKGKTSRKTPEEILQVGDMLNLSERITTDLIRTSKLVAKVDSNCVQDGYQLYHHTFFLNEKAKWCVVQQGMNTVYARRYHWIGFGKVEYFNDPHSGIATQKREQDVLNLAARESQETREVSLDILKDNPIHLKRYLQPSTQRLLSEFSPHLKMPTHHELTQAHLTNSVLKSLQKAYEIQPEDYEELVSLKGIGAKSLRALALISEVVYGAKPSWRDPAKYSWAHGGKDGWPYPVDKQTYDSSLEMLKSAIQEANLGNREKINALKRLANLVNH